MGSPPTNRATILPGGSPTAKNSRVLSGGSFEVEKKLRGIPVGDPGREMPQHRRKVRWGAKLAPGASADWLRQGHLSHQSSTRSQRCCWLHTPKSYSGWLWTEFGQRWASHAGCDRGIQLGSQQVPETHGGCEPQSPWYACSSWRSWGRDRQGQSTPRCQQGILAHDYRLFRLTLCFAKKSKGLCCWKWLFHVYPRQAYTTSSKGSPSSTTRQRLHQLQHQGRTGGWQTSLQFWPGMVMPSRTDEKDPLEKRGEGQAVPISQTTSPTCFSPGTLRRNCWAATGRKEEEMDGETRRHFWLWWKQHGELLEATIGSGQSTDSCMSIFYVYYFPPNCAPQNGLNVENTEKEKSTHLPLQITINCSDSYSM